MLMRARGFTLVELLVTIVIMAILLTLAMPSMSGWVRNSRLRAASDSLQDGLRTAQAEALRRSRQVVFSLTDDKPTTATYTAKNNGKNWVIKTIPLTGSGETATLIEVGVIAELSSDIQIAGPANVCFSSIGRMVANSDPGTNFGECELPTTTPPVRPFNISYATPSAGIDRPLRVTLALGGQVRLCDPAKTLSSSAPDGCP